MAGTDSEIRSFESFLYYVETLCFSLEVLLEKEESHLIMGARCD